MPINRQDTKAANGTGSVERRGKEWVARISLPDGRRPRITLPNSEKMSEAMAREKAAVISEDVRRPAGDPRRIVFDAPSGSPLAVVASMTVRQVGEAWTSGKLYKDFGAVDGLGPRKSGYVDGVTLAKHVYAIQTRGPSGPVFGDLPIVNVSVDDARAVMGAQRPEEQALQTRRHTYARIRQVFDFAEQPLKLRPEASNPFSKRLRPRRVRSVDVEKEFTYLYPSEAVKLAGCTDVLLARRVFDAVAVATGFDVSTLPELSWGGLDPANRTLYEARPKTSKPVFVYANPAWLFDLLEGWRELSGAPAADAPRDVLAGSRIFPAEILGGGPGHRRGREAGELRADLQLAGLTRPALFENTKHTQRLRFHDLRATFETWARRAGWDQRDIDARTGHASKAMGDRYDRAARTLAELQEVPFPNLAMAIPEVRAVLASRLATRLATEAPSAPPSEPPEAVQVRVIKGCEGGDLNPYASYGASTSS